MMLHNGKPPLRTAHAIKRGPPVLQERPLPPKREMARNAAGAFVVAVKSKFKKVSDEEQARRLAICRDCEFFRLSDSRCAKCGCQTNWKSRLAAWHCPIEKW